MFEKVEILDNSKHQDLRLAKVFDFTFAKKVPFVPISASELMKVSASYPIVFSANGDNSPIALLSLRKEHNAYVDEKGGWKVPYVPAYFRHYPFVMAKIAKKEDKEEENKENKEQFALCVDTQAGHFKSGLGDPLFTANGEPVDLIKNTLNVLKKFQEELIIIKNFFSQLNEKGLLVEKEICFEINHTPQKIDGFSMVDMAKFKELDDHTLAGWAKTGDLAFIYDHIRSLSNLSRLAGGKVTLT